MTMTPWGHWSFVPVWHEALFAFETSDHQQPFIHIHMSIRDGGCQIPPQARQAGQRPEI